MEITQKQWKEFLIFKEEYEENEGKRNLLLQNINDTLEGNIRSANLKEYRNTYIVNAQDSLDENFPLYIHFNIISEMVKIVSIKLSFWLLNFRAYSKSATEKEAVTSGASSEASSASGGGDSTGIIGDISYLTTYVKNVDGVDYITLNDGDLCAGRLYTHGGAFNLENHYHTTSTHTHNIPHTHTIPKHSHGITYGIYEEETSPTIVPSISRDNGLTYSLPIGSYTKDQETLDITRFINEVGSKIIKFESNARARLSIQITVKLDIKAR